MSETPRAARTLALGLAYEGTAYHGFGIQPDRTTVQEMLETALAACLAERVRVTAAGRTDAGVHATGQVVTFVTTGRLAAQDIVRAANAFLPEDVRVTWGAEMPAGFDARRSALRRHYRYCIWNDAVPDLWRRRWTWHVPDRLDERAMDVSSGDLVGRRDFASFAGQSAREPEGRTTVRTVERATWHRDGPTLTFDVTADAFLRHMVRGVVGTLVQVGRGKLGRNEFGAIVEATDRRRAGPNAPSHGLTFVGVEYPAHFEAHAAAAGQAGRGRPGGAATLTDRLSKTLAGRDARPTHLSSGAAGVPQGIVPRGMGAWGTARGGGAQ